jgi:hypothetical protein
MSEKQDYNKKVLRFLAIFVVIFTIMQYISFIITRVEQSALINAIILGLVVELINLVRIKTTKIKNDCKKTDVEIYDDREEI